MAVHPDPGVGALSVRDTIATDRVPVEVDGDAVGPDDKPIARAIAQIVSKRGDDSPGVPSRQVICFPEFVQL